MASSEPPAEPTTGPPPEPPTEFEFSDPDILRTCLQMLGDECSKEEQRHAIDIMLKLCRNIMMHPGEEKYLKIRKENKAIHDRLLRFDGAREFLLAMGWSEIDDVYMFLQDQDLSVAISILDEQLNTLPPPQNVPVSSTNSASTPQSPGQSSVWTEEELKKRERQLEEDRKKRMEEYKRVKREKEEIKKQIKEDRKDTSAREVQASHARPLNTGDNFHKFENKGGG